MAFEKIAQFMYDVGFYDVILPFLFVFTLVYAILQKSAVFGKYPGGVDKRNVNAMVAFVVGFIFVASIARVAVFESVLQRLGLALIGIFAVALVLSVFGGYTHIGKSKWLWLLIFFLTIAIFVSALGYSDFISGRLIQEYVLTPFVIMIVAFLASAWFIVRDKGEPTESTKEGDKAESKESPERKSEKKEAKRESKKKPSSKKAPAGFKIPEGSDIEFVERVPGEKYYK